MYILSIEAFLLGKLFNIYPITDSSGRDKRQPINGSDKEYIYNLLYNLKLKNPHKPKYKQD
jgi:hypothetical protein